MRQSAALIFCTLGLAAIEAHAAEPAKRVPVLLELFTSEGCSSCPPADRLLAALDEAQPIASANLIVLSEHVDYWNSLGWKDPFSSRLFSSRQEQYASHFKGEGVYTPQLVVDGAAEVVGGDKRKALAQIEKAAQQSKTGLEISNLSIVANTVHFHLSSALPVSSGDAELFVALAQCRAQVHVEHGENAGSLLSHTGVVRVLTPEGKSKAGESLQRELTVSIPSGTAASDFKLVAFLQDSKTRQITGAVQTPLQPKSTNH